ncbi:survival motor neuron protein-like isoform X4 [Stegodyphus dumicola]|uniref:survival motor neuron protein-like isoform X4 n=1 Tax=Stegodyphus dumicola TaxID=202533 RepID=UPI0015AC6984|nr:survival motor neuron protein-like isoform X4 [Stegodyphus dumicola]
MKDKAKADARKKAGGDNSSVDGSYSKAKGRKQERERETKKWRIGDYCRAIYPEDNLRYEAEIVHISGEKCIVCFLGYEDELEVNMNNLVPSRGKRSQNKQIKKAKKYFSGVVSSVATPAVPPIPPMPMAVSSVPQIPPMPVGSDLSGNSALSAAMTAWYMAGYYTGFFEGQKQSQCVQRCGHNTVLNQPPTPPMPTNPDAATAPVLIAWYMAGYYTGFYETQNKSCGHHCGHKHTCSESNVAENPSLSSAVTGWYMAGYYTGLQKTQKSSHDTHHAGHAARGYCHH